MTLAELQAKRDEVLASIDTARITAADGRSVEFISEKSKTLALIDAEIAKLQSPQPTVFTIQTERGL